MENMQKGGIRFGDYSGPVSSSLAPHFQPEENMEMSRRHSSAALNAPTPEARQYHRSHAMEFYNHAMKQHADMNKNEPAKTVPLKELIGEHEKLVADLDSGDKKKLKEQAKEQKRELAEYKEEHKDKMDKFEAERVEVTADGKISREPGQEPLKKPVHKSMREYWDLLKAKISADKAFMDLKQESEAPEEQEGDQTQDPGGEQQPQQEEQGDPKQEQPADDRGQEQEPPEDAQAPDGGDDIPEETRTALIQHALKDEGYSDSEIAYIVHGHVPVGPSTDDFQALNERMEGQQDREHNQRSADLEHEHQKKLKEIEQKKAESELASLDPEAQKEHDKQLKELEVEKAKRQLDAEDYDGIKAHKQKMRELELEAKRAELEAKSSKYKLEHEKRMLDLEYEQAKLEMELDIENKRKENELKLKQKQEIIKQSTSEKKELAAIKHENAKVDAATPPDTKPSKGDK